MRITTWNVNSLRKRQEHLDRWLRLRKLPEVVCLQETKVQNEQFPTDIFTALGYEVVYHGQKTYNGVCIASRFPLHDVVMGGGSEVLDREARIISATIEDIRIINVYVPNGSVPQSDKYIFKFEFLKALLAFIKQEQMKYEKVILVGDINIAHQELDVWNSELFDGHIMYTQAERNWLSSFLQSGFVDVYRNLHPDERGYSWYDYITQAFQYGRGWRIDYIFASPQLMSAIHDCVIDQEPRSWDTPSDHCPVVVLLKNAS